MGMFDSFYDQDDRDWQTKAFDCDLEVWRVGDPFSVDGSGAFQVEVIGDGRRIDGRYTTTDSFVTIADGVVVEVPADRDHRLPLVGYSGGLLSIGSHAPDPAPEATTAASGGGE